MNDQPARKTIDQVLAEARARIQRVSAGEAYAQVQNGAVLVDIRPSEQRAREGHVEGAVPGAITVERNVLEWRFDPASEARLPQASGYDVPVIVLCQEGYTSSLAAAALQELGLTRATDVDGGFRAWVACGLPWRADGERAAREPRTSERPPPRTPFRSWDT